jgi:hypothetical protein
MTLTYKLELEDWLAFNRFYRQTSPILQKQMRTGKNMYTLMLMSLMFSTALALQQRVDIVALGSTLIFGLIMHVWIGQSSDKNADKSARQIYESGQNKTLREPVTLTIGPNFIETVSALSESKMKWPLVEKIAAPTDYIFIYISASNALIIPKRAFNSEEQRQQCIELLQRYHAVVYA